MRKFVVLALIAALPGMALAYGIQVPGQLYSCSAKASRTKVRKQNICASGKGEAQFTFIGRWDDWDGQKVTCVETNRACVYEK